MKSLTMRQPFAALIEAGLRGMENTPPGDEVAHDNCPENREPYRIFRDQQLIEPALDRL